MKNGILDINQLDADNVELVEEKYNFKSVLDDVSQTVHDWSELSESKFDFEIEYLKYSHIVVHIKQIRKIIRYV